MPNPSRLRWLAARARKMDATEILFMRVPRAIKARLPLPPERIPHDLHLHLAPFDFSSEEARRHMPETVAAVISQADAILAGRFPHFGGTVLLHDPIDWQRGPLSECAWPRLPARRLDYRRLVGGDPKDVWELNRFGFLPTLALAYCLTGEERYADRVFALIESWLADNPPGIGINATSGIEAAIRQLHWLLALRLMPERVAARRGFAEALAAGLYAQTHALARHLSLYSSANNHLIAELCGLAVAGEALGRTAWLRTAAHHLEEQAPRQILADGTGAEQAPSYLVHTLEFYAHAAMALERTGFALPEAVWARLEKGAAFLHATLDADGAPLSAGDNDGGVIARCDAREAPARATVRLVAGMSGAYALADEGSTQDIRLLLLLGSAGYELMQTSRPARTFYTPPSRFSQGGLRILRARWHGAEVRAFVDVGPLGMPPLFGHGHPDALSLTFDDGGLPLLIDPGTFTYFGDPAWRQAFRSTRAHNTLTVDGLDQTSLLGPFLAESDVPVRVLEEGAWFVEAEHGGYRRLTPPVTHRRRVELTEAALVVRDLVLGASGRLVTQTWQLAPEIEVSEEMGAFLLRRGARRWRLRTDAALTMHLFRGDEAERLGWVAPILFTKLPTVTLLGSCRPDDSVCLVTRLEPLQE